MKSSSQVQRLILCCVSIVLFIGFSDYLAAQTPDLIISAISTTTGPVAPNAQFSLSNSAKNQGTAAAGSFVIAFHLSVNNTYGGADDIAFTQTRTVASLAAGATSTANTNVTVPASTPLGNYYVCALSDSNSTVTESNETNNSLCTASTIQVAAADLIMSQVTPNASTVNAGATLSVTNAVQNLLNVKTGTLRIAFRLSVNTTYGDGDDVTISTVRNVSSLGGNATNTATTNLTIATSTAAGNYYVCAKADSLSVVVETNEANNTLCSASTVSVVRPTITTLTPASGPVGTSVTITGSGFGATQGTSTVKFNGITATPTSWSAASIVAPVPAGATTGNVVVTVAGVASNGVTFTVTAASNILYVYDELGRLVAVTDTATETAIYNYDAVGNLLSISRQSSTSVSILEFTPNSGPIGTSVTIFGTGFSATPSQNTVTFNGVVATVSTATTNQIVVTVPAGATTGLIAVTAPGGSATSTTPFTVATATTPTISGFNPAIGTPGTALSITGSNFETIPSNNNVKVNITSATVISATTNTISTSIPSAAASGRIRVATPLGSALSSADLFIPPAPYLASDVEYASRMSIGGNKVITINNVGKIAMVLFDGLAGQQISLNITGVTISGSLIYIYNPNGTVLSVPRSVGVSGANFGPYTLPSTGSYTILVDTANRITTVAGTGKAGWCCDGALATNAQINSAWGVAIDGQGNVFIADTNNNRIRKVDANGTITTFAGTGAVGYSGDNGPAINAKLQSPKDVAIDGQGNLFIADMGNQVIRKVNLSGIITTIAGDGYYGYGGDGGPATSATLFNPQSVKVDAQGNIFIADRSNNRIRKVNTSGIISTIAGTGVAGYNGDGIPATSAKISNPEGVTVDSVGNVYFADTINHRIRKIDTGGIISTVAGTGLAGYSGDAIQATTAKLNFPSYVALDLAGNIFISDSWNHRIRKVDSSGIITTVAGNGLNGYSGDGGSPTAAQVSYPRGLAVKAGTVFIVDALAHIRMAANVISSSGSMTLNLTSP